MGPTIPACEVDADRPQPLALTGLSHYYIPSFPPIRQKLFAKLFARMPLLQARVSAGEAGLETLVPKISKQRSKQLDGIELIRLRRETRNQRLCFSSRGHLFSAAFHSGHSLPAKCSMNGGAPAILDPFVWLSYRCFTARGEESIPIYGDFGLVQ
jgi:hypothetical protein